MDSNDAGRRSVNLEDLLAVVWRRRVAFLVMFVVAVAAVVLATLSLPKVYESTATIYVGGQETDQAENVDTNFGQQIARTYAALASGATVVDRVRAELPDRPSRTELLGRMTFAPVEGTRLLQITAEGSTPAEAARTANLYGRGFVSHVGTLQAQNSAPSKATLVETAAAPTDPARPNVPLYIGLGVLLSALIAGAVALLVDRLDKHPRITDADETLLDMSILGRVPLTRGLRDAVGAEAFRLLKLNLELAGEPARTVVVTSARPGEGKSTVTSGLARAIRGDGDTVAVIEADLRRSGAGPILAGSHTEPMLGLAEFMAGTGTVHDIAVGIDASGATVIPAGPAPSEAAARLRPERFSELVDHLLQTHDWVLIDGPPVEGHADSLLLASRAERTLLVVDPSRSTTSSVAAARRQLWLVGAWPPGVVLNKVQAQWTAEPGRDAGGGVVATSGRLKT
jgi:polysaccharide biosynthesis transport protein